MELHSLQFIYSFMSLQNTVRLMAVGSSMKRGELRWRNIASHIVSSKYIQTRGMCVLANTYARHCVRQGVYGIRGVINQTRIAITTILYKTERTLIEH
jgi:hypothetical protein